MRRGALLKEAQFICRLPTSVGGGENADGNWSLMAEFCGPGSVMLAGFLALIAPCGGSFGLPKEISCFTGVALAAVVAVITAPAAVAASTSRLDIMTNDSSLRDGTVMFVASNCGLTRTRIVLAAGVLLFRSWWDNGSNGLVSG